MTGKEFKLFKYTDDTFKNNYRCFHHSHYNSYLKGKSENTHNIEYLNIKKEKKNIFDVSLGFYIFFLLLSLTLLLKKKNSPQKFHLDNRKDKVPPFGRMVGHKNKNTFLDNENFLQIDIHFCKQMTSKFRIKKKYIFITVKQMTQTFLQ